MPNDIGVRLNGDNSGFRRMLDDSVGNATQFAGQITKKVGGKLTEMRDVSTAIASALGINIQSIAENMARFFTGMTKAEEDAWKKLEQVTDQLSEEQIKNIRATLTEEQKYQANLKDREKLIKQIDENQARTGVQILQQKQDELALAKKSAQIIEYENKLRDEALKKSEEALKNLIAAREKEYQSTLATMDADQRIAALKESIVAMQAVIASGVMRTKDTEQLSAQLQERKTQLVAEEAKAQKEKGDVVRKNLETENELMVKRDDALRSSATLEMQHREIVEEIAVQEALIRDGRSKQLDITKDLQRLDTLRGQQKQVENKQTEQAIELAKLLFKGEANLTAEEKLRLQVLKGQTTQKEIDKEITDLTAKFLSGVLTPAEKERLAVLVGQSDEIKRQLEHMEGLTRSAKEFVQTISRRGSDYEDQSTTALEGIQSRLKSQLDAVKAKNANSPSNYRDPMQFALQNEYERITRELSLRNTIGDYSSKFGEDQARFKYGDALTDRALRELQDVNTKTLITLQDIQQRIANVFTKK